MSRSGIYDPEYGFIPDEDVTQEPKPQTNADRIRAMTDEELADFLDRWEMGDVDYSKTFCDLCDGQYDCHDDCLMDWLKSPVEKEVDE